MALEEEQARNRELARLLESSGFLYGLRSAANLLLLDGFSVESLLKITLAALHTPSPDMALNGFERLAVVVDRLHLSAVVSNRRRLAQFMALCGSSPFLTNLIFKEPGFFIRLFVENELEQSRSRSDMLHRLRRELPEQADMATLMKVLRRFKRFEILRIAARDLNGLAPLEEVTRELSDLAAATIQVALETCERLLVREHGLPLHEDGQRQALMTVIGMGKLGGRELNFSSDIDIIYFYETDRGETAGVDDAAAGVKG